ncbi:hypothetical protein APHAL10511_005957 [Amanita phalloides]|nr:hypothetical protein APHAL10511_005957 [Amanita phalloides]
MRIMGGTDKMVARLTYEANLGFFSANHHPIQMTREIRAQSVSQSASRKSTSPLKLKHSRSLMISPNLDALLEFEERHRDVRNSPNGNDRVSSPPTPLTSLPPPPRHPRGAKSFPGELVAIDDEAQRRREVDKSLCTSSSESNPFINPAPTLQEILLAESRSSRTAPSSFGLQGQDVVIDVTSEQITSQQHLKPSIAGKDWQRTKTEAKPSDSHGHDRRLRISILPLSPLADSMFNFLNLSSPADMSPASDRHSFIDFLSPTQSDATIAKPTNANNDDAKDLPNSPSLKLDSLNPRFDLPSKDRHGSPSGRKEFSRPSRPPTTNLLDMNERADLVRKSRKLAHVFGQTPEAGVLRGSESQPPNVTLPRLPGFTSRRHSLPLTIGSTSADATATDAASPVSFMDLSDEDDFSAIILTPRAGPRRCSVSSASLSDNLPPEAQAEEERRRKREKLAKLHRFLGSRVPASLVLGLDDPDSSLPPETMSPLSGNDEIPRKAWRRRRSSYVPETNTDRIKADLGNREKAINVKRAQKMEKVFGVAPPQTLYHTRHIPSPSEPSVVDIGALSSRRNWNRTAYTKNRVKKESRPESSESSQDLLPKVGNAVHDSIAIWSALVAKSKGRSKVYSHYQHSLNSLHDILDRDDKASLAELHQYLNGGDCSPTTPTSPIFPSSRSSDRRSSNASSAKSDRRLSLPTRTSMVSIASEISVTSPKPEVTDFQLRRRRAAKLAQFFGVDYRELINDVLESIESGLEHERNRGTLQADEIEDLLQRLRELKIKRKDIC